MNQRVIVLGSTGSIGSQTLAVCQALKRPVAALTAGRNKARLLEQALAFQPDVISIASETDAAWLRQQLAGHQPAITVLSGRSGNNTAATWPQADLVMAAMVGVAGLEPVLAAIRAGKTIALANKETLVSGGALVMPEVQKSGSRLIPVDSEHAAIFQCLSGQPHHQLKRLFLTASGGPFRGWSSDRLATVTVDQALDHPTWRMGGKITIDSATLMNKGLEVIEAAWLFDCPVDAIEVVVHPQSIIHAMVELSDGSVLAQLGFPDMKLPIQYALTWPDRLPSDTRPFDPFDAQAATLTFERPDRQSFPLLDVAYEAARLGGTAPAVMNAANEAAVGLFLAGRISFPAISRLVTRCLDHHLQAGFMTAFTFDDMMNQDQEARAFVLQAARSKEMKD